MIKNNTIAWLCIIHLFFACGKKADITANQTVNKKETTKSYSYLALGDSYTVGESVDMKSSFPFLLTEAANKKGIRLQKPLVIAKTGWRTDELYEAMNSSLKGNEKYDLISVLIGVNNQYQGKNIGTFKKEVAVILDRAISLSESSAKGVFAFSIPDYSVTPFMQGKEIEKTAEEIKLYNQEYQDVCKTMGVHFYDITRISQEAKNNPSLVATDGLHPSAKMYELWIAKYADEIIQNNIKQ